MNPKLSSLLAFSENHISAPVPPLGPLVQVEVAELIVSCLHKAGVEYVFGVPGGAVEPIYNALARSARQGGPRPVVARHEAGAAYMADGYARETGRLGVCVTTSGPGATNLLTGIACARGSSVPLLALTGQSALPSFGRNALQDSSCAGGTSYHLRALHATARWSRTSSKPRPMFFTPSRTRYATARTYPPSSR